MNIHQRVGGKLIPDIFNRRNRRDAYAPLYECIAVVWLAVTRDPCHHDAPAPRPFRQSEGLLVIGFVAVHIDQAIISAPGRRFCAAIQRHIRVNSKCGMAPITSANAHGFTLTTLHQDGIRQNAASFGRRQFAGLPTAQPLASASAWLFSAR